MNYRLTALAALSTIAMATPALAGNAAAMKGAELAPMAHIALANARATAIKVRPGKITDQELEKERGGSGLRYSFDIVAKGHTYEVGVDAKTGAVLQNSIEGKNPD